MTPLSALLAIEHDTGVKERPLFFCQPPDGRRDWGETPRQNKLFKLMGDEAPDILGFPIPNAGKRNPNKARLEHIMSGVFDTEWQWPGDSAHVEMKGYDARGRAGVLSENQILWGNRMHLMGKHVACFFDPVAAVDWLRRWGGPFNNRWGI